MLVNRIADDILGDQEREKVENQRNLIILRSGSWQRQPLPYMNEVYTLNIVASLQV